MKRRITISPGGLGDIYYHARGRAALRSGSTPSRADQRGHTHDELELNVAIRGRARYVVAGRWYQLQAGTVVWLFPNSRTA